MSIYRARLRNTSNALSPQVSSEQIRLQVPPKLFGVTADLKLVPAHQQQVENWDARIRRNLDIRN